MEELVNEVVIMKEIIIMVEIVEELVIKVVIMEEIIIMVEIMEELVNKVVIMEEIIIMVVIVEIIIIVIDGEGVMFGIEVVNVLEDKRDDMMEEVFKEDVIKVVDEVIVVKSLKDEMLMDVDVGIEKGLNVEGLKEEMLMDVDVDI